MFAWQPNVPLRDHHATEAAPSCIDGVGYMRHNAMMPHPLGYM